MNQSISSILAVLLLVGISEIANGETKENIYSNKFIGLHFAVPRGWWVATGNETKEFLAVAASEIDFVMDIDDPDVRAAFAAMPDKVLLVVSGLPLTPSWLPLPAALCKVSRKSPFIKGAQSFCGTEGRTFESYRARQLLFDEINCVGSWSSWPITGLCWI